MKGLGEVVVQEGSEQYRGRGAQRERSTEGEEYREGSTEGQGREEKYRGMEGERRSGRRS